MRVSSYAHLSPAYTLQHPETTQRAILRRTRVGVMVVRGCVHGCCVRGTSAAAGGRVKAKGGEVGVVRTGHRTAYGALVGIAPS